MVSAFHKVLKKLTKARAAEHSRARWHCPHRWSQRWYFIKYPWNTKLGWPRLSAFPSHPPHLFPFAGSLPVKQHEKNHPGLLSFYKKLRLNWGFILRQHKPKYSLQLRILKFNMWTTVKIDWSFHLKQRAELTEADDTSHLMCQWNFPLAKSRYQNSGVWQNPITTV